MYQSLPEEVTEEQKINALKFGIFEHHGALWAKSNKGDIRISNFTITPQSLVTQQIERPYYVVKLKNNYGIVLLERIPLVTFLRVKEFKHLLASLDNFIFTGKQKHLNRLLYSFDSMDIKKLSSSDQQ
jgi:hypothetical protein